MNPFAAGLALTVLPALASPAGARVVDRTPPRPAQLCVNCHIQTLQQQATPDAQSIPLLGAQQPKYLENAILAYARRQRDHFFLRGVAAELSADERAEVVRCLASAPPASARPGAKAPMPAAAASCVACHGDATRPPTAEDIPRLAEGYVFPPLCRRSVPMADVTLNHLFKRLDFGVDVFAPHGTRQRSG